MFVCYKSVSSTWKNQFFFRENIFLDHLTHYANSVNKNFSQKFKKLELKNIVFSLFKTILVGTGLFSENISSVFPPIKTRARMKWHINEKSRKNEARTFSATCSVTDCFCFIKNHF